jgi:hypothetical protein
MKRPSQESAPEDLMLRRSRRTEPEARGLELRPERQRLCDAHIGLIDVVGLVEA